MTGFQKLAIRLNPYFSGVTTFSRVSDYFDNGQSGTFNSGAIRFSDTLTGIVDDYTGELLTFNKVSGFTDSDIDGVILVKKGSEFFKRNLVNDVVNLASFGVVTDGTNQRAKIQKAIYASSGKTLFIPPGVYYTSKLEGIDNIVIDGLGTLKAHPDIANYEPTILFYQKSNFVIRNISFDGNKGVVHGSDQDGSANIILSGCHDCLIDNIKVLNNAYVGVAVFNSDRVKTNNSTFINTDCAVIHFGGDNWECLCNYAEGGTSDGFVAWGVPEQFVTNVVMSSNRVKDKVVAFEFRYCDGYDCSGNFAYNCVNGVGSQAINNIAYNGKIIKNTLTDCWIGVSGVYNNVLIQSNTIVRSRYHGIMIGLVYLNSEGQANGRSDLISSNVITSKNILIDNVTDITRGWGIVYSSVLGGEIEGNIVQDNKPVVLTNNSIFLASVCDNIKLSFNDTFGVYEGFNIKIQASVLNSQLFGNSGTIGNEGTLQPVHFQSGIVY